MGTAEVKFSQEREVNGRARPWPGGSGSDRPGSLAALVDRILHPADTLQERLHRIPNNDEALACAIEHARAGRVVIACMYDKRHDWKDDSQKRPIIWRQKQREDEQLGFHLASADPAILSKMFSKPWARLVGLRTGEANGVAVLDVDMDCLFWLMNTPEVLRGARVQRSMGGGVHLFYRHALGLRCSPRGAGLIDSNGQTIEGVHIRAEGGYIIDYDAANCDLLQDVPFDNLPGFPAQLLDAAKRAPARNGHHATNGHRVHGIAPVWAADWPTFREFRAACPELANLDIVRVRNIWHAEEDLAIACARMQAEKHGNRNTLLNLLAYALAKDWTEHALPDHRIEQELSAAARLADPGCQEGPLSESAISSTIASGLGAGRAAGDEAAQHRGRHDRVSPFSYLPRSVQRFWRNRHRTSHKGRTAR